MAIFDVITCTICIVAIVHVNSSPLPGHHHVHHRIIVPQKIKTIHHTKIIKVPEHHHYFHEKEKIIQLEAPHHKDDFEAGFKDLKVKLPPFDHDDNLEDFSDYHGGQHYGGERHNIFKKHAIVPKNHSKGKRAQRKKEDIDDEDEEE